MLQQKLQNIIISNQLNSQIHVWDATLDQPEAITQKYYSILPSSEKNEIDRYRIKKIRDRQILSKGLLRVLLSGYLKIEPQNIELHYNNLGKPFISSSHKSNGIFFNLSHSNNLVVYGFVKNKNIGIDIEQIQEIPDLDGVVDLCFSKFEKKWFNKISPNKKKEMFYKIWTCKEAYLKAIGKGFSFSADKISLCINHSDDILFKINIGEEDFRKWSLITFSSNPNFTAAIVVENNDLEIEYFSIDPSFIQEILSQQVFR